MDPGSALVSTPVKKRGGWRQPTSPCNCLCSAVKFTCRGKPPLGLRPHPSAHSLLMPEPRLPSEVPLPCREAPGGPYSPFVPRE